LRAALNLVNWDDGGELSRFAYLHPSTLFPMAPVRRGGSVAELPEALNPRIGAYVVERKDDQAITLDAYLAQGPLDGLIVLHRGRIVYEAYPHMQREQPHLLFSVTKAFVGTLVALLEDRGQVALDRPVNAYVPDLRRTSWDGISVRDVLEMASGMEGGESGPEAYSDPTHKHYQLEASLGMLPLAPDMVDDVVQQRTYPYLASLDRVRKPGTQWEYASVNTALLAWLVERVTSKPLAEVLSEELWSRIGADADAAIVVNRNGVAAAHAGLTTTLRDLARFGLLFTDSWRVVAQERVVPESVSRRIREVGRPQILEPKRPDWLSHVAYQWDGVTKRGDFYKGGFGNQLLYVAPRADVVIAYFGTNASLDAPPAQLPLRQMVDDLF
jgi:CubicO group peptidase (beta-lactamase class C family)